MALKVREVSENSGSGGIKFTGLTLVSPLIVNPNKEQLGKMGIQVDEEPKYLSTETDEKTAKQYPKVRLTFYFLKEHGEGEARQNIVINHSVFLEGKANYSNDASKIEVIDKFGKGFYMDVNDFRNKNFEKAEYLDHASIAACYSGQSQLIGLMRTLVGSSKDDETTLRDLSVNNDPKNLFAPGGQAELNMTIAEVKKVGNKVKVLLGIRSTEDGKHYQDIFPYNIGRAYSNADYFHKELVRIYGSNSRFFQSRDYGPINLSVAKANEEEYRLRIWENETLAAPVVSDVPGSSDIGPNGFPASWETKPGASAQVAGSESAMFDPFG